MEQDQKKDTKTKLTKTIAELVLGFISLLCLSLIWLMLPDAASVAKALAQGEYHIFFGLVFTLPPLLGLYGIWKIYRMGMYVLATFAGIAVYYGYERLLTFMFTGK